MARLRRKGVHNFFKVLFLTNKLTIIFLKKLLLNAMDSVLDDMAEKRVPIIDGVVVNQPGRQLSWRETLIECEYLLWPSMSTCLAE